jgi:hypothetical protein
MTYLPSFKHKVGDIVYLPSGARATVESAYLVSEVAKDGSLTKIRREYTLNDKELSAEEAHRVWAEDKLCRDFSDYMTLCALTWHEQRKIEEKAE